MLTGPVGTAANARVRTNCAPTATRSHRQTCAVAGTATAAETGAPVIDFFTEHTPSSRPGTCCAGVLSNLGASRRRPQRN
ncbi:hypothetical protein GCM10023201_19000 [Actinomycetospora corticicola]